MSLEDTNNPPSDILVANRQMMLSDVRKWLTDIACGDLKDAPNLLTPMLLGLIALRLGQLVNQKTPGANYYRITSFTLQNEGQRIIEKQVDGLVRTAFLWVDKGSGGATPYIRVGTSKVNMVAGQIGSGGIQVNAGQSNELGNVRPETELWAASSIAIMAYVIEFA